MTFTLVGVQVTAPRVDELVPGGAAANAGFKPGDVIISIDGQAIEAFADMQRIVSANADHELTFEVNRGGTIIKLKATPARREISDRFGNKLRVGRDRHPPQPDADTNGNTSAMGRSMRSSWASARPISSSRAPCPI